MASEPSVIRPRSIGRPRCRVGSPRYPLLGSAKSLLRQRFSLTIGRCWQSRRGATGRACRLARTGPPLRAAPLAVPAADSPANAQPEFTHSPITAGGAGATPVERPSAHPEPPTFVGKCSVYPAPGRTGCGQPGRSDVIPPTISRCCRHRPRRGPPVRRNPELGRTMPRGRRESSAAVS